MWSRAHSRATRTPAPQAGQGVGTYNNVYFERGSRVAVVNGEPRSSLITFPSNGRIPERTQRGQRRIEERRDSEPIWGIRPPGTETARRTLPHFVRFPRRPAHDPQRGLQ